MKNIYLILFSMLALSCNAQVYDLNDTTIEKSDATNGAYFKDIYGTLNPYIGVWTTTWNSKTAYLEFKKIKYKMQDLNGDFIYVDSILGERKIINANGVVEVDRISNFDNENSEFSGIYNSLDQANWKRIGFYPKNMCRKMANLDITSFTGTTMTLHFEYEAGFIDPNCIHNAYIDQYGDYPMNFPKDIVLTKQ